VNKRPNKRSPTVRTTRRTLSSGTVEDVFVQPWFLPKRIADAIRGMVPPDFQNKMGYYFEDYGCLICKQETVHHSNGMCLDCYAKVLQRMKKSVKRHARQKADKRLDLVIFRQQKLARNLLKDLAPKKKVPAEKLTLQMYRHTNPVFEALGGRHE
jgi:hypothetical protein